MTPAGPTTSHERVALLDAVRGVALGGILLANLMSFFGTDMMDPSVREALPLGEAGEAVLFAINWLVEGKFYSIFSMLLGVGFAMQFARARARGESAAQFGRFFRRRMGVLIAIGVTHMYALWSGDILTLYGVMGLLLPSIVRWPVRARAMALAALFCVPIAVHVVVLATDGRLNPRPPFAAVGAQLRQQLGVADRPALDVFAHGSPSDYWAWNASFAVARPGTYLQSGRPAKVLALFLLGAWIGHAVVRRLHEIRRTLWMTVIAGAGIGLPASLLYAAIKAETGSTFLLSSQGLVQTIAYTMGTTPLALAYMAAAALMWHRPRARSVLRWFEPLGRMALTVYLAQTLIQVVIFTSVGAGFAGRTPLALLPAVAAVVLVMQRYACSWWLRRYQQGPVERLWRRAAYASPANR
ncbi:MAG TPA: DUF418 domain-containing protein [Vicinamibacterales bacterium]|nr:DUF418 domain-containing protein [Vicinamibacterales bacterium]